MGVIDRLILCILLGSCWTIRWGWNWIVAHGYWNSTEGKSSKTALLLTNETKIDLDSFNIALENG